MGRRADSDESAEEPRIFATKDFTLWMRFGDPPWLPRPLVGAGDHALVVLDEDARRPRVPWPTADVRASQKPRQGRFGRTPGRRLVHDDHLLLGTADGERLPS
ncbi:hypothetical protein GCM10010246_05660 [Streptomyces cuspidosporus]|uniref:Uncharacterized protein n=1 Tax=Streptomyces cuspidosporus TaxID=66882 RepID=A0ABP5SC23_9ACTN